MSYESEHRHRATNKGTSDASKDRPRRTPNIPIGRENQSANKAYNKAYSSAKRQRNG